MGLIDDYFELTARYGKRYAQCLVLFQVGSFYEIYASEDRGCADMRRVCDMLGVLLTRKNKNLPGAASAANPWMAGFPCASLDRYLPVLLDADWHVVMYEQTTPPPNPQRAVTRVLSKGTHVADVKSVASHNVACVHVEHVAVPGLARRAFAGYAVLDLATGRCAVSECVSVPSDPEAALDELYRALTVDAPVETLLVLREPEAAGKLAARLDLAPSSVTCEALDPNLADPVYQEALLRKAYPQRASGVVEVAEALDVRPLPLATVAFAGLLRFAYQHDETCLRRLQAPDVRRVGAEKLTVCYNSLKQLGVVGPHPSLCKLLNRCRTGMGYRLFQDRLVSPIADATELQNRYDAIDAMSDSFERVREVLKGVCDTERSARKLSLQALAPPALASLRESLACAVQLRVDRAEDVLRYVDARIDASAAASSRPHVFRAGVHPCLDALSQKVRAHDDLLDRLAQMVSGKVEQQKVVTTERRFAEAKRCCKTTVRVGDAELAASELAAVKASGSYVQVTHARLTAACEEAAADARELERRAKEAYDDFQSALFDAFGDALRSVSAALAELDVVATCAWNAQTFCHRRPDVRAATDRSSVRAVGLRHPVIERLQAHREYVSNDVEVGAPDQCGVLLYGLNAAGKSSLAKAIGVNVIMAQAGMFVACDAMTLVPYTQLFSRISSGDDVLRNQSTFTIEMTELRNILKRADGRSLVIGDELCAGTEQTSALAIVASGLRHLCDRNVSHVFATHLHELVDMPEVAELAALKMYHLTCRIDPHTGALVYERKLRPGPGDTLYGLEVCRALQLPSDFLRQAQCVRLRLLGRSKNLVRTKRSAYNRKVIVDVCAQCQQRPATETHHVRHQADADARGFFERYHKNAAHNLRPLCEACHATVHHSRAESDSASVSVRCEPPR
jgi:DNA mismatch repair protein MutS